MSTRTIACLGSAALLWLALLGIARAAPAAADHVGEVPALQVVTLNLYHDKDDWPARRVQIVRELQRLQADVIALQEVIENDRVPNQARWLAEQLGYRWYFASTDAPGSRTRYGNAMLTRHRILARGQKRLRPMDDSRTAAFLRIDLQGHPVNVYVTHLHWTEDGGAIRKVQVDDLAEYLDATSGKVPSLVAGDFNAAADAPELGPLRRHFGDAWSSLRPDLDGIEGSTLNPAYHPPRRIDHVFFQGEAFRPLSATLLFEHPDERGIWASDHRGVLVSLGFAAAD
ncbi:MAG: endonuclease/exonuclease/phosphatase family protein [Lysobacteraceae bacterium]|nr:MAG: endonuclease/exonuclease/phosphatase family protein [Xanthomonadaceae bacterium]